jgi:DNA-binding MarR family transcriptional regulator
MGPRTSLGDVLFSGVQQRVLGVLFGMPDKSFYRNELMRLAGSGKGALQRELDRLEKSGLVTVRPVGNQNHYQANRTRRSSRSCAASW